MRFPSVVRDQTKTLEHILRGLDHKLTVADNLAPEGTAGQVLTSNGPNALPTYQAIPGTGSNTVTGTGTPGTVPLWDGAHDLTDSKISQVDDTTYVNGPLSIASTLTVSGTSSLGGNTTINGWLDVVDPLGIGSSIEGPLSVTGNLLAQSNATVVGTLDVSGNSGFQQPVAIGLQASSTAVIPDVISSESPTISVQLGVIGRQATYAATNSTKEFDGPGINMIRAGSASGVNTWSTRTQTLNGSLLGFYSFSGQYNGTDSRLINAAVYALAQEDFVTYGTHGLTDLVFATKASGTGTANAQPKWRVLGNGNLVPHSDTAGTTLGEDTTPRRVDTIFVKNYIKTDADTGAGGIVHWWLRTAGRALRWGIGLLNTESTGNAGSDLSFWAYADNGSTLIGKALGFTRSTLAAAFAATVSATQFTSTIATGTAPFVVASTTVVANLHATNSDQLGGVAAASYALLASPTFTGVPAAPTAAPGTNTTQIATTAFVTAAIAAYTPPVTSVFGRTGAVVATSGDYSFSLISGTIASSQVSGAYGNITGVGTLASGAVPASLVTAGTFGAGAYTFPSTLAVTTSTVIGTDPGGSALLRVAADNTNGSFYFAGIGGLGHAPNVDNLLTVWGLGGGSGASLHPSVDTGIKGVVVNYITPSTATGSSQGFTITMQTQAAAFNAGTIVGLYVTSPTVGAGSSSTTVYGQRVDNQGNAAFTTSYGLFVNSQSGSTNTYGVYSALGLNYFGSPVSIVGNPGMQYDTLVRVGYSGATHPGTTTSLKGFSSDFTVPSTATGTQVGSYVRMRTAAAAFSVSQLIGIEVDNAIIGAGSSVATLAAINIAAQSGAATTAYGITIGNITGGATNYAIKTGLGLVYLGDQLQSAVATGTAPFIVASNTVVANLHADNADNLGGVAAASYALLASPTFTGTPAAPTPSWGDNSTKIATTEFVDAAGWTYIFLGSDVSKSTTGYTDTGLAFTPTASENYEVEAFIVATLQDTATNLAIAYTTPDKFSLFAGQAFWRSSTLASGVSMTDFIGTDGASHATIMQSSGSTSTLGGPPNAEVFQMRCIIKMTSTSPTVDLKVVYGSLVAGKTVTVKGDSFIRYRRIG